MEHRQAVFLEYQIREMNQCSTQIARTTRSSVPVVWRCSLQRAPFHESGCIKLARQAGQVPQQFHEQLQTSQQPEYQVDDVEDDDSYAVFENLCCPDSQLDQNDGACKPLRRNFCLKPKLVLNCSIVLCYVAAFCIGNLLGGFCQQAISAIYDQNLEPRISSTEGKHTCLEISLISSAGCRWDLCARDEIRHQMGGRLLAFALPSLPFGALGIFGDLYLDSYESEHFKDIT